MIDLTEKDDSIIFGVRVVPRASKSEIVGKYDRMLKIRLAAPPVEGAANKELVKLLAKTFKVAKRDVEIISGETSRTKQVRVYGLGRRQFLQKLVDNQSST